MFSGSEETWSAFQIFGVRKHLSVIMPCKSPLGILLLAIDPLAFQREVIALSLMGGSKGGVRSGLLVKQLFHAALDVNSSSVFVLLVSHFLCLLIRKE